MTNVYFIRHAQPDNTQHSDEARTLTEKGRADCIYVTQYLQDKNIHRVYSSPFPRAAETVRPFAEAHGLAVHLEPDFRERAVSSEWVEDFRGFAQKQWQDFSFRLPGGECLAAVTARNVAALQKIVAENAGKNLAVGSHGTAIAVLIHHFNPGFGYQGFCGLVHKTPHAVHFAFDETGRCTAITQTDLLP